MTMSAVVSGSVQASHTGSERSSVAIWRRLLLSLQMIGWVLVQAALLRGGYALRSPLDGCAAWIYRDTAHHWVRGDGWTYYNGRTPETTCAPVPTLLLAGVCWLGGNEVAARELWAALGPQISTGSGKECLDAAGGVETGSVSDRYASVTR